MEYLLVSLVAGMLTVLAPCILPLLPVIVGGSLSETKQKFFPLLVAVGLAVSVIVFSLILQASTILLGVPISVWTILSGGIVLLLGLAFLFPSNWEAINAALRLNTTTNKLLGKTTKLHGVAKPLLIGAALGPVFASCSPTYAFLLAQVLPQSFFEGLINIAVYTIGMAGVLLAIAYGGRRVVSKLAWASNPHGWFKRGIGVLFILVGLAILTEFDKTITEWVLTKGWYDPIAELEFKLR